ncbi:MAG: IclR family transcriptional regulator [Hungatella sp.]|nr:IclR family transcriptional regulator [Hungatella sp.]
MENTTNEQNEKYMLQSVTNALRIIEILGEYNFLTLTEIAEKLSLGKSSVFRLVATLEARGFVKKDKYGRCRLGMKFSYFGSVVLARMEILQASRPYLEELQRNVRETVHLAVWDDDWNIRFIDKIDGAIAFHMKSFVGLPKACYSTATGKSMLAFMGEEFIRDFLNHVPLVSITPHTITESSRLLESLDEIRCQGYCLSVEEDELGLTCIGAPVIDASQKPVAAISISGPTVRMMEHVSEYPGRVMDTAKIISESIS